MAPQRKSADAGRRGAKPQPRSGPLSDAEILTTVFVQACAALDNGDMPRSSLPPPVLKLIRKHRISDLRQKLLALRTAAECCASSTFHGGSGREKKAVLDAAIATARKLKTLLEKIDKARGDDLVFAPMDDGSLAHPVNGSSFAVLPGPRKRLSEDLDKFIAIEQPRVKAAPSKGGRPLSYSNGTCDILARVLSNGRSFRLTTPDHILIAEELFGDLFVTTNGSDALPRLRDAVERSRGAVHPSPRKTIKK